MNSDPPPHRTFSVYELSQFVYCPRAGVIAVEADEEDSGEEGRPINLGYLPRYLLMNLEAAIARYTVVLCVLLGIVIVAFIMAATAALANNVLLFRLSQWTMGLSLVASFGLLGVLIRLLLRRREALGKKACEPEFSGDGAVPIHWWELRAAGFVTRKFESTLISDELGVKGRPWAILVRGTECIPVLRMHGENDSLYANHYVRIAGYCHLIEASTNYRSPYGIILLPRRLDAMAVPSTDRIQEKLRGAVEIAQHAMAQLPGPDEPSNEKVCFRCPFGTPKKYIAGKTDTIYQGKELPPNSIKHNGDFLHTTCGDRFRWDPPALKAIKKSAS